MWCAWPGILPPRVGGSARTAGTSSSGRTAKTTLRAWPGSSPVTAALMGIRPSGSGGLIYIHPGLTAEPLVAAVHDRGRLTLERQFVIMRVFGLVGGIDSSGGGLVPASPSGPVQLCRWCGQLPGQAGEQADLVAGQRRGTSVGICAPTSACPLESVIDCSPRARA